MQNKSCKFNDPNCRGCRMPGDHDDGQDNFFAGAMIAIIVVGLLSVMIYRWVAVDKMMKNLPTSCFSLVNEDGSLEQICDGE